MRRKLREVQSIRKCIKLGTNSFNSIFYTVHPVYSLQSKAVLNFAHKATLVQSCHYTISPPLTTQSSKDIATKCLSKAKTTHNPCRNLSHNFKLASSAACCTVLSLPCEHTQHPVSTTIYLEITVTTKLCRRFSNGNFEKLQTFYSTYNEIVKILSPDE